jgi:hypothetical protein
LLFFLPREEPERLIPEGGAATAETSLYLLWGEGGLEKKA